MFKFIKSNKISIVIISYNTSDYISECIDSVLSQTNINKEIICVDDCSCDDTYKIICEYAKKYPEIIPLRNSKNMGLFYTRYYGLKHCNGDYVFLVDGDDKLQKDTLSKLYKEAKENKADILEFIADSDAPNSYIHYFSSSSEVINSNLLDAYIDKRIANAVWNKLISKQTYKKALNFINPYANIDNYSETIYFLHHFLIQAKRLVYSDIHGYFYYKYRGITSKATNYEEFHYYCCFKSTMNDLEKTYGKLKSIKYIWNIICNQAVEAFLNFSEEEQKKYFCELNNLMPIKNANFLIEERKKLRLKN